MASVSLKIALAQLNPTMGDLAGNVARLRAAYREAAAAGADLVMTAELYLCGYPPEDLVVKESFVEAARRALDELATETGQGRPALLVGAPWREDGKLYNAAVLLDEGKIAARALKYDLPNYGPFDEKRVFSAAPLPVPLMFRGVSLGVMICEDMWTPVPAAHLEQTGAELLLVPNGSPYESGKLAQRRELAAQRARETGLPLVYLNQVGGQDELVFDGASFAVSATGEVVASLPEWEEKTQIIQYNNGELSRDASATRAPLSNEATTYGALMLGLRDYVDKNGFPGVVLGLSGGVDSALAAALAVDALGAARVRGVRLPSPYTSQDSMEDAELVARALGCRLDDLPIEPAMQAFDRTLSPLLGARLAGIPQENIQSRSRGLLLMAVSNATGEMVLSTGNKSEMSVGYATLYGDMCGGFSAIKDVYKTQVYRLCAWRNAQVPVTGLGPSGAVIPARVLTKAPTAELRPNQTDQDSLPPYDVLDAILERLIERDMGVAAIVAEGFDPATVARVWSMLDRAEYKRRQAAPGVKITRRNLGRDRRYPITNRYREG